MGKYMKKSKIAGGVAVMELSQPTTLGVCTRAKTLALQRLQSSPSPTGAPNPDASPFSYLQLRSRRLEKPSLLVKQEARDSPESNKSLKCKGSSRLRVSSAVKSSGGGGGGECEREKEIEGCLGNNGEMLGLKCEAEDLGVEASFGDNCLELEPRERSTRESTPSSLIRDSDNIATPGSTTRRTSSTTTNQRVRNDIQRNIPTMHEMEEFFTCAEKQQQTLFIEKYNFDIVNDMPLPGRYEWVQIIP